MSNKKSSLVLPTLLAIAGTTSNHDESVWYGWVLLLILTRDHEHDRVCLIMIMIEF
jgi:hypothetical protein